MVESQTNKTLFEEFDKDGDGAISPQEWAAFLGQQVADFPTWEQLDLDKNGVIDLHEFEAILPQLTEIVSRSGSMTPRLFSRTSSSGLEQYLANIHDQLKRKDSCASSDFDKSLSLPLDNERLSIQELHEEEIMKTFVSHVQRVVEGDEAVRSKTAKDLTVLGLDDPLPTNVPIFYKSYRLKQMHFIHFAVKWCKSLKNGVEPLKFLLEQKSNVNAEAAYEGFGRVRCLLQPIHLAAAEGSIDALELLLKYGADKNARVNHAGPHSTPLHDAAFLGQVEVVEHLMKVRADPNTMDKKTMQPLHVVAQQGSDPAMLKRMVTALVMGKANLGCCIDDTEDNQKYNKQLVNKTPLQIAADLQSSASFPKDMLYLLAQSSWEVGIPDLSRSSSMELYEEADLFEEVLMIAKVNRNAAVEFTQSIKNKTCPNHDTAFQKLRNRALDAPAEAMSNLSELFQRAPLVAADLLDMLTDCPAVQNKQQHPLPTCVDLGWGWFKVPMRCEYQDDDKDGKPCWRWFNQGTGGHPEWHNQFTQEQVGKDSVYNVRTVVLWLPDVLNIELVTAIAGIQSNWGIEVFGQLAIQGIIDCIWDKLVWTVYSWRMIWDVVVILLLLFWNSRWWTSCMWIALLSSTCLDIISLYGQQKACARLRLNKPWPVSKSDRLATAILFLLVLVRPEVYVNLVDDQLYDRHCDILLSFNIAFRFTKLVYGLRAFQETGQIILSIQESLVSRSVWQMLVVAFLFFAGSLLTFLAVRGPEQLSAVVLAVFKALILTDSAGLDVLSGLSGGDGHGIYTSVLGHVATPFYTICLLTLVTAVYSNEYENIAPISTLLFQKSRAGICSQFMLHAYGLHCILPSKRPLSVKAVGAVLVCSIALLASKFHDENIVTLVAGMMTVACLVYMLLYVQMDVMESKWELAGISGDSGLPQSPKSPKTPRRRKTKAENSSGEQTKKQRFLWICHREDFDPTSWRDKENAKEKQIEDMQRRLDRVNKDNYTCKVQMDKMERTLQQMIENQEKLFRQNERLMTTLDWNDRTNS